MTEICTIFVKTQNEKKLLKNLNSAVLMVEVDSLRKNEKFRFTEDEIAESKEYINFLTSNLADNFKSDISKHVKMPTTIWVTDDTSKDFKIKYRAANSFRKAYKSDKVERDKFANIWVTESKSRDLRDKYLEAVGFLDASLLYENLKRDKTKSIRHWAKNVQQAKEDISAHGVPTVKSLDVLHDMITVVDNQFAANIRNLYNR